MIDLEKAKLDPASMFQSPKEVLQAKTLSRAEKIDILSRWAYEERELAVAEEENMLSHKKNDDNILDEILNALLTLGVDSDQKDPPPTKQG